MLFMFDMGNVIIKDITTLDKIAKRFNIDYSEIRRDYELYGVPLTEGFMDTDDYYRHLEIKYGIKIDEDVFKVYFNPTVNSPMISFVDKLRANGHRVVIASNTFKPHWDYILTLKSEVIDHFDALYASHIINRAKPDKAFYSYIIEKEGYRSDECVFIDDRIDNIEGAESLGIKCFNYLFDDDKAERFFKDYL